MSAGRSSGVTAFGGFAGRDADVAVDAFKTNLDGLRSAIVKGAEGGRRRGGGKDQGSMIIRVD
jgi:hypothetical protein